MLKGKVCIVTGGSRGIGKAISQLFAANGAIVYAIATKSGSIEEWAELYNKEVSGEVRALYFDISNDANVRNNVLRIKKECNHIDVLVNNAAVEYNELIGMINPEHMHRMVEVNIYGTINMLQVCSRLMARNEKGGSIINISSLVGERGNRGQLVYSATKGAVIAITKSAAKELASKNIRVNAVAPGLTNTDMMKQVDQEKLQSRINNISMGRLAEPDDIAKACLFMASELSEYVSGQVLSVDGCTIM